jgi:serine/threonine-protein kinase
VAENYNLLIVAIMTHPAPSIRSVRPDVPKDIAAVVDRALAQDVGARFSSAHEMRDALVACAPADLPAVRPPSAEMGLEPTMPSDAGIPVVSTPIRHAPPSPLSPGITTQPEPAKTPPSGAPPARAIPPTMGTPIIAAAPTASTKGSRTSLVVGLVVLLGAVVGGTIAAFLLISPDAAEEPPPPAFVTTQPSVSADAAMQPSTSADAAMQPSAPADSVEARIAELEERARRAEADAVEAERQRAEEEEARAEAARRAQKRRAAERADLDAMRQAAVQRCQIDCQMQLGRCQRESGGMGREGLECHTAWTRCRNGCDPP